ncbi:hypothetical protein EDB84DRAFT_1443142 [Lactarius hengduanensis]|nr:hypothetical protein EDB84DRAFT_1443142 [Lactarius hengduanensis]
MPFWGCVRGNASLQVDFEPETTLVLVLSARYASTPALDCRLASSSNHPTIPTPKPIPNDAIQICCKLLRALLKAVWRGLKRAIGPLVTRINGMGWRIRMDLKVHLNVATGSGDVVDRSFGPIRFEFSRGIEAIPSVEGADQNSPLLSEHFLGGCILSSSTVFHDGANMTILRSPQVVPSITYIDNTSRVLGETIERNLRQSSDKFNKYSHDSELTANKSSMLGGGNDRGRPIYKSYDRATASEVAASSKVWSCGDVGDGGKGIGGLGSRRIDAISVVDTTLPPLRGRRRSIEDCCRSRLSPTQRYRPGCSMSCKDSGDIDATPPAERNVSAESGTLQLNAQSGRTAAP